MRFRACLFGAILAASGATSASADMVISEDRGGQIGQYVHAYTALASAEEHVIIDGPCLSACTLMLGIVSRERICATSRAQLGFHAAWLPDAFGHPITSPGGTQLLLSIYPPDVRSWISRHGGLSRTWIFLKGRELASMVPSCVSRGGVATLPLYTTKSTGRMNEVQKKNAWKNYAEGLSYRKSKFVNLMYSNNDPNAGPQEWTFERRREIDTLILVNRTQRRHRRASRQVRWPRHSRILIDQHWTSTLLEPLDGLALILGSDHFYSGWAGMEIHTERRVNRVLDMILMAGKVRDR